jgi:hypothetical protein
LHFTRNIQATGLQKPRLYASEAENLGAAVAQLKLKNAPMSTPVTIRSARRR